MKFLTDGHAANCQLTKLWLFKKDSVANGVSEKYWEIGPAATGTNGNGIVGLTPATPIDEIFSEVDDCGIISHPNPTDADTIIPTAVSTDPGSNDIAHESEMDFWIKVPATGAILSARVNGYSSWAVYFGSCREKLMPIAQGINTTFAGSNFFDVPLGTYAGQFVHARLFVHDPHQSGKIRMEWDIGNGLEAIPEENLISSEPTTACYDVWIDKKTGRKFFQDGEEILPEDYDCFACEPCGEIASRFPIIEEEKATKSVTHERATGTNTYAAPFSSFSLTAYSDDVEINGEPVECGQVINLDGQCFDTDQDVEGTDYFVTVVN